MPQVQEAIYSKETSAVSRMVLGAQVISEEVVPVNNFIRLHSWKATSLEEVSEEHGRFLSLPIGDGQYSVRILYLQHPSSDLLEVHELTFHPQFFAQWSPSLLQEQQAFRFDRSTEQQFALCQQSRMLLEQIRQPAASGNELIHSLQLTEMAIHLFRRAVDSLNVPFTACPVPACRFLAYDREREKIFKARTILEQQYDQPITIKELSRKVAMNECYLKKGFKALVGKTIHEYQQLQRIMHARKMLQEEGRSVTEVAALLGYSSISHFSTAFKKATGTKPCELLQ